MPKLPSIARRAARVLVAAALALPVALPLALPLALAVERPAAAADVTPNLWRITLPPGFRISVYAEVPGARSLSVVDGGRTVFVGTRRDSIYAVEDRNGDHVADDVVRVKSGLKVANGIVWHDGYLYVAEQDKVVRYAGSDAAAVTGAAPQVLYADLPDNGWHGWRYAAVGPDNHLYVAVGSPCNICTPEGIEGTILRLPLGGGAPEVYASGIRNSVGIDFAPGTGVLYFTDNGADNMGDNSPPDELNRAPRPGLNFGFPYFGGGSDRTREYRQRTPPPNVQPVIRFGAHVAPLGVHFYRGSQFPEAYRHDAFVAQHGSWNRSIPDGYRVVRVSIGADGSASYQSFAEGWLQGRSAWGRPVDIKELGDGSLLVSDDRAGVIYRIAYEGR